MDPELPDTPDVPDVSENPLVVDMLGPEDLPLSMPTKVWEEKTGSPFSSVPTGSVRTSDVNRYTPPGVGADKGTLRLPDRSDGSAHQQKHPHQ